MKEKPNLSLWQIWNMSFGFLGIQYGFGLQQANMSPIYRYLGAEEADIPGLWLAGPLTGLILQPIIGALSDRSWSPRWGRRKPYIFFGAVAGSIAMILMPNSTSVFMAACLMWLLDAGLNSSMEPFRAFVGDLLNPRQRPVGFSVQSFMVGFGQTLANLMPFILPLLGISLALTQDQLDLSNGIPNSVRYPFYIGAAAILLTVLWTMYTTREYPPENEDYKRKPTYSQEQLRAIRSWRLALTIGGALLAALFTMRLSYQAQIKQQIDAMKLATLETLVRDLNAAGTPSEKLERFIVQAREDGVVTFKLKEVMASLEQDARIDPAMLTLVQQTLAAADAFHPQVAQQHLFLSHSVRTASLLGLGVFVGLFLLFQLGVFKEILAPLSEMPQVMRQLWWVKFFTWYGLPLMWQYLSLSVAKYAFSAPGPEAPGFEEGKNWGNLCFAMFSIMCFVISIFMPAISRAIGSRRGTHALFLTIGALGFFITLLSNSRFIYLAGMSMVGLAWGSIMSMPYLMLANAVSKERMGVYMGIFNGFICVPQFINMLTVPLYYKTLLGDDPRNALILAGICLLLAGASNFLVQEKEVAAA